jgi:ribosomal protein L3 glutamine methyltransferase
VQIPRSPLAEVIERGFAPWCELAAGDRILDVGTGSGCLAIAAAHHCPGTLVDATDTSAAALAVAAGNVARHGLAGRVDLINADLFPSVAKRYRVIISNPPYVSAAEWAVLPPEYAYEPAAALVGGPSGIEPATRLLEGARARLAERGVLIVEVGVAAEALMQKFPRLEAVWIELERGGEGAFAISAEELERSGF